MGDVVRIAICDDNKRERDEILSLFQTFSLHKKTPFICQLFENGFTLLDSIESGAKYDLIVLDILMPNMTGIETARQIRKTDNTVKIIFLTSSSEFAVDSYAVGAYFYILKPIKENNLFEVIEKLMRSKKKHEDECIIINTGKSIKRIALSELVYIEIQRRTVSYHLENGTISQSTGTLSELEQDILRFSFFAKPHRSFLVNLRHVIQITQTELITDIGTVIPLARGRYDIISDAFLTHVFEEEPNDLNICPRNS
ncbi:MAG TPA: DNA-binding response regulator [Clostridiales bacterium]|nr:DNA-binding response regulator [Clostridiales bacterium]